METLFEKIKALGVTIGQENLKLKVNHKYPIDKIIKGEWLHTQFGDLFEVESSFIYDYQHGNGVLKREVAFSKLLDVSRIENKSSFLEDILFIDTETTGLSGGTGTMVFMVGLGYFTKAGFLTKQYFLDNPSDELALIIQLNSILEKFKILVSYNGSSFDIPLLKTRFLINRVEPPFKQFQHLDLLHLSRKLWKLRLPAIKLRDVETEILHFIREEEEVPGWMVPQIYFDFVRNRDARPLKGVFYHNCMDVLSLAIIFNFISDMLSDPGSNGDIHRLDLLSIARLFETNGFLDESTKLYKKSLDTGLPDDISPKILFKYGQICYRLSQPEMALEFWNLAFQNGDFSSAIQISKYYEHRLKKYDEALKWAMNAHHLLDTYFPINQKKSIIEQKLQKRIKRLELLLVDK
jgi:uncharacterized protein YprB with RNaseH-like and TPR domain